MDAKDSSVSHVREMDHVTTKDSLRAEVAVMGTVKLTEGTIIYVPTPTADPRDPLNMKPWHKMTFMIAVSTFSCVGTALVGGFGGLFGFYIKKYAAAGKDYTDMTHLMTLPILFMGIGNMIGIPIAYAVGRRIVFLAATVLLVISAILCATAQTYEWHLAARMVLGLAAGQSEALIPMMVQEIHFLHERGRCLMILNAISTITTALWILCASPIAKAITPQGWYALGGALGCVQFLASIFLVPESKYDRSLSSYQEMSTTDSSTDDEESRQNPKPSVYLCTERPPLDFVNFEPRTWRSDMRLWIGTPDWSKAAEVLKNIFQVLLFPNVCWAICLNGLLFGVSILIGTTYYNVITKPPYNWPASSISYVTCGIIVVALVAIPLLGTGSDKFIKWKANRNGGIHEPENRLIILIFPMIIGIFSAVLYGQGAQHPKHYNWFLYMWVMAAGFFALLGAHIVAITYLLDSYPARAGALLIALCVFRAIISFGVSYGVMPFIEKEGYALTFEIFSGLTAAFGLLGIPIYIWGKKIRKFTGRFAKSHKDE